MTSSPDRFFVPTRAVAELPIGVGRIFVCQLDLDNCVEKNPGARIFAGRLLSAPVNSPE